MELGKFKKRHNSRALIGVKIDWEPHEPIFHNWSTSLLLKESECDLPTLMDELPLIDVLVYTEYIFSTTGQFLRWEKKVRD